MAIKMTGQRLTEHDDLRELSVAQLFQSDHYTIPAYQRNYAWGEAEIIQLIQDVMDVAMLKKTEDYYIGSLVVYRRADGYFETIDGQQRHTTLSILLSVLKNEYSQAINGIDHSNLGFDSRKVSDRTLRKLFTDPGRKSDEPEERNIIAAYEVVNRTLASFKKRTTVGIFTRYLLQRVKILRVVVPADTELNHYFEIMNNRGEQLEKHEVLKARLMEKLESDKQRHAFACVWEACADMNRYVQMGIDTRVRNEVFGKKWDKIPDDFDQLSEVLAKKNQIDKEQTLAQIIATPRFKTVSSMVAEQNGTFSTIITFPNFLLHVLRLMTEKDVPLDDKRLLESFNEFMIGEYDDPEWFIVSLLQARILFDRYIIKRENDEDWSLKTLKRYLNEQNNFNYVNSSKNDKLNKQLTMLLAMLHVSFPAQVYKHWLNAALYYLVSCWDEEGEIDDTRYLEFLENLSNRIFFGRYGVTRTGDPLDFYEIIYKEAMVPAELDTQVLREHTHIPNFIFNRLDYLLWRRLTEGEMPECGNMHYVLPRFKKFSFTFRTSVEHYYPRNPLSGQPLKASKRLPEGVDSFGNLCLISRSTNSKLSNYLPNAKKEHYRQSKNAESLKQVLMMSYPQWGPEHPESIAKHQDAMIRILCEG
ncbi:MAG TPA: hypothetical protein DDY51_15865 [Erwinia persicina]|nr:hypothetical protein [Erwinia persicina]HBH69063.1 hypothetical protein [Erwinia persicina]